MLCPGHTGVPRVPLPMETGPLTVLPRTHKTAQSAPAHGWGGDNDTEMDIYPEGCCFLRNGATRQEVDLAQHAIINNVGIQSGRRRFVGSRTVAYDMCHDVA